MTVDVKSPITKAYETFGLSEGDSHEEVRQAYVRLVHQTDSSEGHWGRVKEMDWAYEVLTKYLRGYEKRSRSMVGSAPAVQRR